jgi:hypothetical protein
MPHADAMTSPVAELPLVQRVSAVLWPSFLFAGAATVVFFALIDPLAMLDCQGAPPLSRTGAYSLGFFLFWLLTAGASALTLYFLSSQVPPPKRFEDDDAL